MARVVELYCYPVKGCAGAPLWDAVLTPAGVAGDRSFMVVGPDGGFRSQRRSPRLALVSALLDGDGEELVLRADGAEAVRIEVDVRSARRDVELFGTGYRAIDQGDAAAKWLSDVLDEPSRLVRVPPEHARVTDGATPGTSGFADSSPVHLTAVSSLAGLNERIVARGAAPVPMARFRPNLVVDGWDAHVEDRARTVLVGDAELGYAKLAIRCAVTVVDQRTGRRVGPEPLRTLADYRRAREGGVAFGTKFAVSRPGKLSVGDELVVTTWGESEL